MSNTGTNSKEFLDPYSSAVLRFLELVEMRFQKDKELLELRQAISLSAPNFFRAAEYTNLCLLAMISRITDLPAPRRDKLIASLAHEDTLRNSANLRIYGFFAQEAFLSAATLIESRNLVSLGQLRDRIFLQDDSQEAMSDFAVEFRRLLQKEPQTLKTVAILENFELELSLATGYLVDA